MIEGILMFLTAIMLFLTPVTAAIAVKAESDIPPTTAFEVQYLGQWVPTNATQKRLVHVLTMENGDRCYVSTHFFRGSRDTMSCIAGEGMGDPIQ